MASIKVVGSNTPKKRFFRILMVILIIGLCLLMLSPFIWMIGASLKKEADVMKQGIGFVPCPTGIRKTTYGYLALQEKRIITFYRVTGTPSR